MTDMQIKLLDFATGRQISWRKTDGRYEGINKGYLTDIVLIDHSGMERWGIANRRFRGVGSTEEESADDAYRKAYDYLVDLFSEQEVPVSSPSKLEVPVSSPSKPEVVLIDYTDGVLKLSFKDRGELRTVRLEEPDVIFDLWATSDVAGDEKLVGIDLRFAADNVELGGKQTWVG